MELIRLCVFKHNKIDEPDGRPFYEYNITENTLKLFEEALAMQRCTDRERVQLLAFVSAERFRRGYQDGPWSWDACGIEVSSLRKRRGNAAFSGLIASSLKHWGLSVLKLHQQTGYLSSIVTYGGFPVAFLSGQSPLRALLRQLLRRRLSHGRSELLRAAGGQVYASKLPDTFKRSPNFIALCVKLIDAVADLVDRAGSKALQVNTLDENFPGWKKTLPLSFDGEDAKHLISELLNLASESYGSASTELTFRRSIVKTGEFWVPSTRIGNLPPRINLPAACTDPIYSLQILANGEPVRELPQLARQGAGHYVNYPQPRPNELLLEPPFDHPFMSFGMRVLGGEISTVLGTEGGGQLDAEVPWVFELFDEVMLGTDGIARCELIGTGSTRTRHSSAVVAVRTDWKIRAVTQKDFGELRVGGDELVRKLIVIQGRAIVDAGDNGEFTIRCDVLNTGPHLKLSGDKAYVVSSTTRQVFRGTPMVSAEPAGDSMTIHWRSVGDGHQKTWSLQTSDAKGLVLYRLSDGEGSIAEARALVLPERFKLQSVAGALKVTLDTGWGIADPYNATQDGPVWQVPVPLNYQLPRMDLLITTPFGRSPIVLRAPVFPKRNGFRRLIDGESAPKKLTISQLSEYVGYSNSSKTYLWLTLGGRAGFPFKLRASLGTHGSSLPLALILSDLQALRYSSTDIDIPMALSFAGGQSIAVSPPRLSWESDVINLEQDQSYQGEIRLRHLSLDIESVLQPDSDKPQNWRLPVDFPPGWSIATAGIKGVRPAAVRLGVEEIWIEAELGTLKQLIQANGNSRERMIAFSAYLESVLDDASSDRSGEELAYLEQWLMRFNDVPAEYLDLLKAIANKPADAIRMMAYYHGGPVFESLRATLILIPLYWHLSPRHIWTSLLPWWRNLVGSDNQALIETVTQSFADTQRELMNLDSVLGGIYGSFLIERMKGGVTRSTQYRAMFAGMFLMAKQQWRYEIATHVEAFHGAPFPVPNEVDSIVQQMMSQSELDASFDLAHEWILPVLRAPLAAAWIAHDAIDVSDDLRRQLAYVRHLGPSQFDRLYANSAMLLEQLQ